MAVIDFVFRLRRGTAAQWSNVNPILEDGEPGVETNTKKFKIGDGVNRWSALPYFMSEDSMQIYINEQIANADPISAEEKQEIVNTVLAEISLPDLTLLWANATV